jgi:hypothetical protein
MKQEPVGWWNEERRIHWLDAVLETKEDGWDTPLYTSPRELSNEEIEAVSKECMSYLPSIQGWFSNTHELDIYKFAKAILKKASEK